MGRWDSDDEEEKAVKHKAKENQKRIEYEIHHFLIACLEYLMVSFCPDICA